MPGRMKLPKSICLICAVHDKDSPCYLSKLSCIGKCEEKMSDMSIAISVVAVRDCSLNEKIEQYIDWIASLQSFPFLFGNRIGNITACHLSDRLPRWTGYHS